MALEKLPSKIKEQPLPSLYPNIVNELINQHLIAQQAYKENLDKNKKVLSEINKSKEQIMAKYWLNSYLSQQLDKKNLKNFYFYSTKVIETTGALGQTKHAAASSNCTASVKLNAT